MIPFCKMKDWLPLALAAWKCRGHAHLHGKTAVGCALRGNDDKIYIGCNLEHAFWTSVHAEVNAISSMVAHGCSRFTQLLVVADREKFVPCGGCMDWIFQHGGPDAVIGFQKIAGGEIVVYTAAELMPFYPR